ncbi:uncharacterized protein LOC132063472 [Lycium ferocissimum]|uniref:uncharacterized protein LOC132063472 n=1 Tax=Lycium ferocissimum TaxID=112874 RepID=UPI0028158CA9|nr:uncharacterized protein LOC132063472 [Lycium ferocissimum]
MFQSRLESRGNEDGGNSKAKGRAVTPHHPLPHLLSPFILPSPHRMLTWQLYSFEIQKLLLLLGWLLVRIHCLNIKGKSFSNWYLNKIALCFYLKILFSISDLCYAVKGQGVSHDAVHYQKHCVLDQVNFFTT